MNKIIEKLLTVTFPTVDINNLLEIVSATPNPEVATEILCGLYQEPEIANKLVNSKGSEGILTFKSYDKWQDRVNYSYKAPETKGAYFKAGLKKEDITMENFESMKSSASDRVWLEIPTGNFVERTSYVSLDRWNSFPKEFSEGEKRQKSFETVYEN